MDELVGNIGKRVVAHVAVGGETDFCSVEHQVNCGEQEQHEIRAERCGGRADKEAYEKNRNGVVNQAVEKIAGKSAAAFTPNMLACLSSAFVARSIWLHA